jgi:predicted transposase YdaD
LVEIQRYDRLPYNGKTYESLPSIAGGLPNLIKESFTAKGLKEAQEVLSIMKLPEGEQKAYDRYKDDLRYQKSMFESTFVDGFREGKAAGTAVGKAEGLFEANRKIVLNLSKKGMTPEQIADLTGLDNAIIGQILN